eukprot:Phypoly_transcript_02047.p1 GENE.Phypoly_transcript_02047~~Phypoly_transcript_02047.p1  ORF type:complete len:791 (+),score=118.55 Phypoly_transcript_02047:121-2493(+)
MQTGAKAAQPITGTLHQEHLVKAVRDLFPNEDIVTNVKKDSDVINPKTGHHFEIDLWLPNTSLCFEFQDEYHYNTTWYANVPLEYIKAKDDVKKREVGRKGATLINIPCWWDGSTEKLKATLFFERPDFEYDPSVAPISLNPPPSYFLNKFIPGVGELMYASFSPSPSYFDDTSRFNPWWMGEKYDGVRLCWNSRKETLYTRSGREFLLSDAFYDCFPSIFVDCELWFGRGSFVESQKLILSNSANWEYLRMVAFDNPDPAYHDLAFETRYASLVNEIDADNTFLVIAPRVRCITKRQLIKSADMIIKDGGEGVIVRRPKSLYEPGRSNCLWKIKATREDAEALVLHVERDRTILAQLYDGTTIVIQPGEIVPAKGDIVTITYDNYGRHAVPLNPVIERIRKDVVWKDVVRDTVMQKRFLNQAKAEVPLTARRVTKSVRTTARRFFEEFAKRKRKDPLLPATWYSLASEINPLDFRFVSRQGGVIRSLIKAFPDIGLKSSKFPTLPQRYWNDVGRRRAFFTNLAKNHGFDALSPAAWYSVQLNDFFENKRAKSILAYYGGNFARALIHLYPDIGLDKSKLAVIPGANSFSTFTQREALINFAKRKKFDPLRASGWYPVTEEMLRQSKEVSPLLRQYAGNVIKMLNFVFPEIPFKNHKFAALKRRSWIESDARRDLFLQFAKDKNFDPLVAENWYAFTAAEICEHEGFDSMLQYYEGSFGKALLQLFPNIGLDVRKFSKMPSRFWEDEKEQKVFFMDLAKQLSFDPLVAENWYSVPDEAILNINIRELLLY